MATGPAADEESTRPGGLPSPSASLRRLLVALVATPGRSTATALLAVPYLWLAYYVARTAAGIGGDPIIGGDWLTLVFTTYALVSALALAHRILRIGLDGLDQTYLIDSVVLTWLTGFYFVWMLAREPVAESTALSELYGPVLAGEPWAVSWAAIAGVTALVVVGLVHSPYRDGTLFESPFRTATVTLPALVTAVVLVGSPGPNSVVWPLVGGVFIGTAVGGLTRIQPVASSIAKGVFAVASLAVWTVGAVAWLLVYRRRPPADHVVLSHVGVGAERSPDAGAIDGHDSEEGSDSSGVSRGDSQSETADTPRATSTDPGGTDSETDDQRVESPADSER
jgi:hypothetical protein